MLEIVPKSPFQDKVTYMLHCATSPETIENFENFDLQIQVLLFIMSISVQFCTTLSSEEFAWNLFQLTEILVIFSIGATDHPSLRVGGGALTTLTDRRYPRQIIFNIQLLSAHPGPVVGQSPALSPRAPGSGVSVAPEKCLRMIQCEQKDECRW